MSSAFADGAEVEPEGLGLRDNFVLSGDQIDYFYKVGILTCVEPATTISCIGVCAVDDRALVALPDAAWHRLKKSRKLPSDALQRAVRVAVQPCTPDEREAASGAASLHVWLGLLAPAYEDQVEYDETKPADIDFPMEDDGTTVLPYAGALIAVCKDHFTFLSAESDLGGQGLESRMGKLEEGLKDLTTLMEKLRGDLRPVGPGVPPGLPAASERLGRQPKAAARAPTTGANGLDPVLARQALAAGVDASALGELQKLLAHPGAPQKKASPTPAPERVDHVLDSSGDEEEDAALDDGLVDPLGRAVVDLTKIVKDMRKEKKRSKDKGLEAILDQAEGGGLHKEIQGSSRSKAAALRSLQQLLTTDPCLIYQAIEKQLQADWELSGTTPGLHISQVSVRGWLEHRSRLQNFPSSVRPAWILGGIWDALRGGRVEEARARAALGVAMLDQQACDRGAWLLAAEASLEAPPPYSSFSQHSAPETWELQHSRLLDPRWVELFMAKLKDLADYQEKRAKLGGRAKGTNDPPAPRETRQEGKGKGKGGKNQKGKKESAEEKGSAPPITEG
jgi:hypothetical protein